jgi:hypothetical protein
MMSLNHSQAFGSPTSAEQDVVTAMDVQREREKIARFI